MVLYFRKIKREKHGNIHESYEFVNFDEDKKRIRNYFLLCCPEALLNQKPTMLQTRELLYQIAGAMPQSILKGIVFN